jgi:ribonuclease D
VTDAVPTPLVEPRDGIPDVVVEEHELLRAAEALAAGSGPVAVDAERASGYRYGQAAYLVQLRRQGAGTWLIDPVSCPDLTPLGEAIDGTEWVLHAATQDLPCLAEVGLRPSRLFDTELGARLAGLPRVGLGAVVEEQLGLSLAKEHSAVDWSTRPLPEAWLRYAALDVEVLVDLRDAIADLLERQGKLVWAEQEFAAIADAPPPTPRIDPWRRTSGTHRLRSRRQLAMLRELWTARDELARQRDVSPGRVLPDAAMVAAVQASPRTMDELVAVPGFTGPAARRHGARWLEALTRGRKTPDVDLPAQSLPNDAPPPARSWSDRDPDAAARLACAKAELARMSEELCVPVENLMTPDTVRRVLWDPPTDLDARLAELRARPWQVELVGPVLRAALNETDADRRAREAAARASEPSPASGQG